MLNECIIINQQQSQSKQTEMKNSQTYLQRFLSDIDKLKHNIDQLLEPRLRYHQSMFAFQTNHHKIHPKYHLISKTSAKMPSHKKLQTFTSNSLPNYKHQTNHSSIPRPSIKRPCVQHSCIKDSCVQPSFPRQKESSFQKILQFKIKCCCERNNSKSKRQQSKKHENCNFFSYKKHSHCKVCLNKMIQSESKVKNNQPQMTKIIKKLNSIEANNKVLNKQNKLLFHKILLEKQKRKDKQIQVLKQKIRKNKKLNEKMKEKNAQINQNTVVNDEIIKRILERCKKQIKQEIYDEILSDDPGFAKQKAQQKRIVSPKRVTKINEFKLFTPTKNNNSHKSQRSKDKTKNVETVQTQMHESRKSNRPTPFLTQSLIFAQQSHPDEILSPQFRMTLKENKNSLKLESFEQQMSELLLALGKNHNADDKKRLRNQISCLAHQIKLLKRN